MHRDQTTLSMIQKMKKSGGASTGHQSRHAALPITFIYERPQSPTPTGSPSLSPEETPSPQFAPTLPLTERAACHFASNFILIPHSGNGTQRGFLSYIMPLMESEPHDGSLRFAFNACSLALMSNLEKADGVNLSNLTLEEHTLALARTHAALGNPATANLDSTLATVLLLTLFESITAVKQSQMLSWRTHLQGAINIVKSRGREQLRRTKVGAILLNAVRQQLITRALSEGTEPPMGGNWWMHGADVDLSPTAATCQRLALRTAELRAEVSRTMESTPRTPESRDEMSRLTQVVQSLDSDAANFLQNIPPESGFKTLCWIKDTDPEFLRFGGDYSKSEIYPGRIDVYPDVMTAAAWNLVRVTRLILASLKIRITTWLSFPTNHHETPEYMTWKPICQDIIADIISSAPYQLGWRDTNRTQVFDANPALTTGFACGVDGPAKALPALLLSWALVSVKNHDFCQPNQREWASGRLKFIEQKAGLKYAGVVNEVGWKTAPQFT